MHLLQGKMLRLGVDGVCDNGGVMRVLVVGFGDEFRQGVWLRDAGYGYLMLELWG